MNKKENILYWFFTTLFITFGVWFVLWFILSSIFTIAEIDLSFDFQSRCILSLSLIVVYVLGIRGSIDHEKPIGNKKTATIRRLIGWILVILSLIGIALCISSLIGNYKMVQRIIAEYGEQYNNYGRNNEYNWLFLQFAGRDIVFSGLIFALGFYLIKCGPLYSPIWKRVLKVILYVIATYVLLDNTLTFPLTSWSGLIIVFIVMLILVAITKDYVKEPQSQITEDVEL